MSNIDSKHAVPFLIAAPVEILNTSTSRAYAHVHIFLLIGLFYFSRELTVSDPVSSLSSLLPRTCFLQLVYTIVCLPPAGTARPSSQSNTNSKSSSQPQRKRQGISGPTTITSKIIPAFLSQTLALLVGTPIITAIIILHGAPLTTHLLHTLLAGAHISVLATTPLFYAHGVNSRKWQELSAIMAPIDEVNGAAIGALAGAWLGAIPIPLDWDRDWQKWPVTIVTGSYVGYALGKFVGSTILKGMRFSSMQDELEAEEELKLSIGIE